MIGMEVLCVFFFIGWGAGSLAGKLIGEREPYAEETGDIGKPQDADRERLREQKEAEDEDCESKEEKKEPEEDREIWMNTSFREPLLVNKDNRIPADYAPMLFLLPDGEHQAAKDAYQPLCDMLEAGEAEGLHFVVCSAYRDTKRQQELFDEDLEALMQEGYSYKQAYEEVAKQTMPPGYSEHSTGLAFDIVALDYQMLDEGQEETEENKWLLEHCAQYGFILRYPKDKEEITGISHESWHFRYVGKEIAEYIMEEGITLEEYLQKER